MRFQAQSAATPNAFNGGNVAERLIGTRVILNRRLLLRYVIHGNVVLVVKWRYRKSPGNGRSVPKRRGFESVLAS